MKYTHMPSWELSIVLRWECPCAGWHNSSSIYSLLTVLSLVLSVFFGASLCDDRAWWFVQNLHHVLLKSLFFKEESVLVPNEVGGLGVKCVSLHAAFKERQDVTVVRIGGEWQGPAVLHEFFEFNGLVEAKLFDSNFLLLALNVIIFFVFGASGQTLPGQWAA